MASGFMACCSSAALNPIEVLAALAKIKQTNLLGPYGMHQPIERIKTNALSLAAGVAISALFFLTPLVALVMRPIMAAAGIAVSAGWLRPLDALWPGHVVEIFSALVQIILPAIGLGLILGAALVLCLRGGARIRLLLAGFVGSALLVAAGLSIAIVRSAQVLPMPLEQIWELTWRKPFAMAAGSYAIACLVALIAVRGSRRARRPGGELSTGFEAARSGGRVSR